MDIKVIKQGAYDKLTESLRTSADLPIETDRAVADYRAFTFIATLHASRVTNCLALDAMIEESQAVQKALTERKNVLQR